MKLMLALLVSTSAAFEIAKAKAPMLKAAAPAPVKADKVLALRGGGALGPVSPEIGIYIPTVPDATMKYSSTRRPSQRLFYAVVWHVDRNLRRHCLLLVQVPRHPRTGAVPGEGCASRLA